MRLHDFLDWTARERPDTEFALQGERRLSYGDALLEVNRLAAAFRDAGLRQGDRFGYLAKNSIDFVIAFLASSKTGAVIVPLNYRLAPAEWAFILEDAGASLVISQHYFVDRLDEVRPRTPSVRHWVRVDAGNRPGWVDYRGWIASYPATTAESGVSEDDDFCQMYTSGTTGRPKGAILTHRSIVANNVQCRAAIPAGFAPGERMFTVMPIFHAGGASQVFGAVINAASLVIHEEFEPLAVVRTLAEENPVQATLVPSMIRACLDQVPDASSRRYGSLRACFYGASPIDSETLRRALTTFRCDFYQAYGMTETTAVLTILDARDHHRALAGQPKLLTSAGRPVVGTEVRVVDGTDQPVPPGTPGQIVARGPQLMKGYWKRAEATTKALAGGWMHTGDVGTFDADGYLYLLDRVNDMIVTGGENVYPREVEDALFAHAAVADAAVIGVPDDRFGEAVMACVVLRPSPSTTVEELIAHCRGRIGGYKVPKKIEFVDALPRNAAGNVLKRELRDPYWQGRERRIG